MPVIVPDKVNMNYANMIEEKNLKKGFILATLVSTLVGTFAASHNLYERLSQKKKDGAQDDAIKKLEEKLDQVTAKKKDGGDKAEELKQSLTSSGPLIMREYDRGYDRLGRRFAAGDILTENELQRQIIVLQQTVIGVLEDALYHGRPLDRAGLEKLVWASEAARQGSLDALRGQYRRIVQQELPPARPPGRVEAAEVWEVGSARGSSSGSSSAAAAAAAAARRPPARALLLPPPPPPPGARRAARERSGLDYLCRYGADLQLSPAMPLAGAFDPGRGGRCPGCRARVPVDADDVWEIEFPVRRRLPAPAHHASGAARDPSPPGRSPSRRPQRRHYDDDDDRDRGRSRTGKEVVAVAEQQRVRMVRFRVPARFVVKCHTPEGDYACVLCCGPRGDYSGPVVLCDDPETLVHHVAKEHRISEIEDEVDILPG